MRMFPMHSQEGHRKHVLILDIRQAKSTMELLQKLLLNLSSKLRTLTTSKNIHIKLGITTKIDGEIMDERIKE